VKIITAHRILPLLLGLKLGNSCDPGQVTPRHMAPPLSPPHEAPLSPHQRLVEHATTKRKKPSPVNGPLQMRAFSRTLQALWSLTKLRRYDTSRPKSRLQSPCLPSIPFSARTKRVIYGATGARLAARVVARHQEARTDGAAARVPPSPPPPRDEAATIEPLSGARAAPLSPHVALLIRRCGRGRRAP
jgi:hypothetical protein